MAAPTALVVDAHEVVRYGCIELLRRRGFGACQQAGSISRAYRLFLRRRPTCIVFAWPMEERTDIKLIRRVRSHAHACPIIVYSSHGSTHGVMDALRTGAAAFITKSSPPEIFLEGVRRALCGEMYIRPDIAQQLAFCRGTQFDNPVGILSQRERAVFELVVAGVELAQIANRLTLSKRSVSNYLIHIKNKLGVNNVAGLVRIDTYRKSEASKGIG
jgi:two-component system invasion response regulator UvrY